VWYKKYQHNIGTATLTTWWMFILLFVLRLYSIERFNFYFLDLYYFVFATAFFCSMIFIISKRSMLASVQTVLQKKRFFSFFYTLTQIMFILFLLFNVWAIVLLAIQYALPNIEFSAVLYYTEWRYLWISITLICGSLTWIFHIPKQIKNTKHHLFSNTETRQFAYLLSLVFVILLGFAARYYYAHVSGINLDEGIHLYDAKMLVDGFMPFRDYLTREFYYISTLAGMVKIFGAELSTSRLLSVATSSVCALIIFILGSKIFTKKTGLIAAMLFALSPFVIYETTLGNLYGVYPLIMSICFLALFYMWEKPTILRILIAGICMGAAVHFYRLSIFYYPMIGYIWGYLYNINDRLRKMYFPLFAGIAAIPLFAPIIYFSLKAGVHQFEVIYGTTELILGYCSLFVGLLIGNIGYILWNKYAQFRTYYIGLGFCVLTIALLYSFFSIGIKSEYKVKIFFDAWIFTIHILFFLILYLFLYLKKHLSNPALFWIIKLTILIGCSIFAYYGMFVAQNLEYFGVRTMPLFIKNMFTIVYTITVLILLLADRYISSPIENRHTINTFFWLLIFSTPLAFYIQHVQLFVNTFMAFIVLGCIFAARGIESFQTFFQQFGFVKKLSVIILFIISIVLPTYVYLFIPARDRDLWPQKSRVEITEYIQNNTKPRDEILTNALVYILDAKRPSALNLSRASIYSESTTVFMPDYLGVSKNLIPSKEFADYVEQHVSFILMDSRTRAMFDNNPDLKKILRNYYIDQKWPKYAIQAWKRK